jgi:glycosyltransferase involved in cell wall biosynthesis
MRVLHVYKTSIENSFGGVEIVIDQLSKGLNKFGIFVEVLSLSDNNNFISNNSLYRTTHCKTNISIQSTPISLSAISVFKSKIKEFDIINYHFPWPYMDFLHLISDVKIPTVVTYHSDIIKQKTLNKIYYPLLGRKFLSSVDHIVATSKNYLDSSSILSNFKFKTSVIPLSIDEKSYEVPSSNYLNKFLKLHNNYVLFVGVLRSYKGLEHLIEASCYINCKIIICGSGPLENKLKNIVKNRLYDNVIFLGEVSDIDKSALIINSKCVISTSNLRSEAFCISLLEGAMYGKPLISTDLGTGTSYINLHGFNGIVLKPNNPYEIASAINLIFDNDYLATKMGLNSRNRYLHEFNYDIYIQKYIDLYQKLILEKNSI